IVPPCSDHPRRPSRRPSRSSWPARSARRFRSAGASSSAARASVPTPPPPPHQEPTEDLLARSKREAVPIRWSFVQRGTRKRPQPGPLAEFVGHHDERALDLYPLVPGAASAGRGKLGLARRVLAQ